MTEKVSLRKWIEMFDNGEFENPDFDTQVKAGWYDWFCKDASLASKTKKLAPKVKKIANSWKVNIDTMYVFFKNNCPMDGSLYDDFRICDIGTGKVIWTITPKVGHTYKKNLSEVWGKENSFDGPIVSGTWKQVLNYFDV